MTTTQKTMTDAAKNVRYKNNGYAVMFHQYAIENVVMEYTMLVKNVMMAMITNMMDALKIVQLMHSTGDARMWKGSLRSVKVSVGMVFW